CVAVDVSDLGEAGVNVEESAPARLVVFLAPDPQRDRAQDEQVSRGAELEEFFERCANGPFVRPINPIVAAAEGFETVAHVSRRIIQLGRPHLSLPMVTTVANAAFSEEEHAMAKRPAP